MEYKLFQTKMLYTKLELHKNPTPEFLCMGAQSLRKRQTNRFSSTGNGTLALDIFSYITLKVITALKDYPWYFVASKSIFFKSQKNTRVTDHKITIEIYSELLLFFL